MPIAVNEEVTTTRLTPASRAAAGRGAYPCAGHDQFVCVLGDMRRQRRRHVQGVVATLHRFGPARVIFKFGRETQPLARLGAALVEQSAHLGLTLEVAHRGADHMAGAKNCRTQ